MAAAIENIGFPSGIVSLSDPPQVVEDSSRHRALEHLQQNLVPHLNGSALAEFRSLSRETDVELFYEALYHFGQRLERRERMGEAGLVYSAVASAGSGAVQQQAQARLSLFEGNGSFDEQLEMAGRGFARQALSPTGILTMAGAQVAGGLTTFRVLAGLRRFPVSTLLGHPLVARSIAGGASTVVETGAFMGIHHLVGGRHAMPLPQEFWSTLLTIAPLKFTSFAAHSAINRLHGSSIFAQAVPTGFLQAALPSASMFGGIYLGLEAQSFFDLRPRSSTGNTLFEAFHTFFHFHVAGRMIRDYLGEGFQRFNQDLHLRTELLKKTAGPTLGRRIFNGLEELLQPMAVTSDGRSFPIGKNIFFSKAKNPEGTGSAAPEKPSNRPLIGRSFPLHHPNGIGITIDHSFEQALEKLPSRCRCLAVETNLGAVYEPYEPVRSDIQKIRLALGRALYDSPHLGEIRFYLMDGSMIWIAKTAKGRFLNEHLHGKEIEELEAARRYPPEERVGLHLASPRKDTFLHQPFPEVLRQLRQKAGLTMKQVTEQMFHLTGKKVHLSRMHEYENNENLIPSSPNLWALAKIYRVPLRDLIDFSNQHHYGNRLAAKEWQTEEYPLYLEGETDVKRLENFREQDPERRSLGWLIFSARKNPDRYLSQGEVAKAIGIHSNAITDLELNRPYYPRLKVFEGLSRIFGVAASELFRRANRTHHPTLRLLELFGRNDFFLDPNSEDVAKILAYHRKPGSLGQLFFTHRKSLPGYPTTEELSEQLQKRGTFWHDLEFNRVSPNAKNWREWLALFQDQGIPLAPIIRELKKLGIEPESPAFLLAEAMGYETIEKFSERTGIADHTVRGVMAAPDSSLPYPSPQTVLDLKRNLPDLRGDLLYRALFGQIETVFPEAKGPEPVLHLSRSEIEEAMRFHLGEILYAYRKDHALDHAGMAKLLGIPQATYSGYEIRNSEINDPNKLFQFATALNLNPRTPYLYYRPQILALFKIVDPSTKKPITVEEADFLRWMELRERSRGRYHLHGSFLEVLKKRGFQTPRRLAPYLGLRPKQAQKYLQSWNMLSAAEIALLTEKFPELSYQEWYEYHRRPALAYFLGRKADGTFNYDLPEGRNWREIENLDMRSMVLDAMTDKFPSRDVAGEVLGLSFLKPGQGLNRSIEKLSWTDDTIATIAKGLGLDRRLLFFYFRREELRRITGSPPP